MLPTQVNMFSFRCDSISISCWPWSKEIKTKDLEATPDTGTGNSDGELVEVPPLRSEGMIYPAVRTSEEPTAASNGTV